MEEKSITDKFIGALIRNDFNSIDEYLEKITPTGITHEGIAYSTPLSQLYHLKKNKKDWLKKFIIKGGNLNIIGLDNKTLLYNELTEAKIIDYEFIHHLLIKGANPNIPEYNLPLNIICKKYKENPESELYYKLICLLITFGGNIYKEDVNFITPNSFLSKPITLENVLELKKEEMIDQLKCIFKTSDYQELKKKIVTKESDVYKNNDKKLDDCFNKTTLLGDSTKNYSNKELLIYQLDKNIWCFHMNSLATIIQNKRNPWTNQKMSEETLSNLYDEFHYVPALHANQFKDFICPKKDSFTNKKLLSIFSSFLKSFNHYISVEMIDQIPFNEIYNVSRIIFQQCNQFNLMQLLQYRQDIISFFHTGSSKLFIRCFLTIMIKILQKHYITLPMLSYIIERHLNSYDILIYIKKVLKQPQYSILRNIVIQQITPLQIDELQILLNEDQIELIKERIEISAYVETSEDVCLEWFNILKMIIRNRF